MDLFFRKNLQLVLLIILLFIIVIYIIYLNFIVRDLESDIKIRNNLYNIQINNRITEIEQLSFQLNDLQKLLNIGLDLSSNSNLFQNYEMNDLDKKYIFKNIPNSSPLKDIFITSKYGVRFHPILDEEKFHTGLDLRAKVGTEVYSTADGIIWETRDVDSGGYGKYITILHNYGFRTLYAHLNDVYVKKGDIITKGTLIGLSGNTGRSSGPHLHYEIRYLDNHIDPSNFIYWNKKTFQTIFLKNENDIQWKNMFNLIKSNLNELQYEEFN